MSCSQLFIVKSLYEGKDGHPAGCGDKSLTVNECKEALYTLGYNTGVNLLSGTWNDRPKGCVIGDTDRDTIYAESYFNRVTGHTGFTSNAFKSICFAGIFLHLCDITIDYNVRILFSIL